MSGRKPRLQPDQIALLREWWKWRRISNREMCRRLKIARNTMLDAVRGDGAYRG